MKCVSSEVSLEEPEFVRTVLCQATTQKSVRKADTNWTDQDSEDQKCFNCITVRIGDRVINVECTHQDMIALSAIQSESYTLITGELGRVPSEDNETDLGTKYLGRGRIERCMTKMRMLIGGLGLETVACVFGHWSDHWGRTLSRVTVGGWVWCCSSQLE